MKKPSFRILAAGALAGLAVATASVAAYWDGGDPIPLPPQPDGACIFKDHTCQVIPQNICKLSRGKWLGPNTTCP